MIRYLAAFVVAFVAVGAVCRAVAGPWRPSPPWGTPQWVWLAAAATVVLLIIVPWLPAVAS